MSKLYNYKGFTFEWDDELNQYAIKSNDLTLGNILISTSALLEPEGAKQKHQLEALI